MSAYTISICECSYYQVTVYAESAEGARKEYEIGSTYPDTSELKRHHQTSMIVDVSKDPKS